MKSLQNVPKPASKELLSLFDLKPPPTKYKHQPVCALKPPPSKNKHTPTPFHPFRRPSHIFRGSGMRYMHMPRPRFPKKSERMEAPSGKSARVKSVGSISCCASDWVKLVLWGFCFWWFLCFFLLNSVEGFWGLFAVFGLTC